MVYRVYVEKKPELAHEAASLLHELKNFGIHDENTTVSIGSNAKLDEFRAAMGICNLRIIEKCILFILNQFIYSSMNLCHCF